MEKKSLSDLNYFTRAAVPNENETGKAKAAPSLVT